jgi:hypothetical protein
LISEISPEKSDSGPETTLTDSPIENCARVRGPLGGLAVEQPVDLGLVQRHRVVRRAHEPVTPGVFLTSCQESSVRFMFTSR